MADKPATEFVPFLCRQREVFLRKSRIARLQEVRKGAVPFTSSEMRLKDQKRAENENRRGGGDQEQQSEKEKCQQNRHTLES
jgi:hypothetical protein